MIQDGYQILHGSGFDLEGKERPVRDIDALKFIVCLEIAVL